MKQESKETLLNSLTKIKEGINEIIGLLNTSEETGSAKQNKPATEDSSLDSQKEDTNTNTYTREYLDSLKYNDLKKLASSENVKSTGTRDEITERLLSLSKVSNDDIDNTENKEDIGTSNVIPMNATKEENPKPKKGLKKKQDDEEVEQKFLDVAMRALDELGVKEVISSLEDVDIVLTPREKKQEDVVVRKLAKAISDGLIEFDDEDLESNEGSDDFLLNEYMYSEEYDPMGYNSPLPDINTEERNEAIIKKMAEIISAYKEGTLTIKDMENQLEDLITEEDSELLGEYDEESLIRFYAEMIKRTIDDDGVEHPQKDTYEIQGQYFCCGHELSYCRNAGRYTCEVCGSEYDEE